MLSESSKTQNNTTSFHLNEFQNTNTKLYYLRIQRDGKTIKNIKEMTTVKVNMAVTSRG